MENKEVTYITAETNFEIANRCKFLACSTSLYIPHLFRPKACLVGMFGADCLQECHCTDGADCDDFTGECPGDCSQGWSGPACQGTIIYFTFAYY